MGARNQHEKIRSDNAVSGGVKNIVPARKFPLTFISRCGIVVFASPSAMDMACPDSSVGRAED